MLHPRQLMLIVQVERIIPQVEGAIAKTNDPSVRNALVVRLARLDGVLMHMREKWGLPSPVALD